MQQKQRTLTRQLDLLQTTIKTKDQQIHQLSSLLNGEGRKPDQKCKCKQEGDRLWQKYGQLADLNRRLLEGTTQASEALSESQAYLSWQVNRLNHMLFDRD